MIASEFLPKERKDLASTDQKITDTESYHAIDDTLT